MTRRRTALALVFAACALGCEARETGGRPRLWTLFELAQIADQGGSVGEGGSLPQGIPASYFLRPRVVADLPGDGSSPGYQLTVSRGFLEGLPMAYVTTELWANVEEIWAQPLYRAVDGDGKILEDESVKEPWVFGVGPDSVFYSPFWQVLGFRVPPDTDVTSLLDTRAVLEAANRTGGLHPLERRLTALAPLNVREPGTWVENIYFDDTAAWDGVVNGRYLDLGPGRFDADAEGVVRAFPIFMLMRRNDAGPLESVAGWPTVGGTRPLFSQPPAVDPGTPPVVPRDPVFGGLWRIHTVALPPTAGLTADGRVVLDEGCLDDVRAPSASCLLLDSQAAVESLGAGVIARTELLASCPLLEWGEVRFPRSSQLRPRPLPESP